jgi:hypothetical protein
MSSPIAFIFLVAAQIDEENVDLAANIPRDLSE